jgi:hypothetical protein
MADFVTSEETRSSAATRSNNGALAWEVPEIVAVAILAAFFVIVVGALATGIYVITTQSPGLGVDPMANTWNAISFGASWAEPLLAVIVLGVIGLCWWQVEAWSEEIEADAEEPSGAFGHVRRARQISRWALLSLLVTAIGAVAGLIAQVGLNVLGHFGPVTWVRFIGVVASVIAVLIVAVAGLLVVQRLMDPDTQPGRAAAGGTPPG